MAFRVDGRKIAKNTFALYIRLGITMVISFFTARVTLEQLGVEDYGLNNLVGSIVSMLAFLNGSMGTAVQRFYSIEIGKENEKALSRIFGVGLSLHAIVALISLTLAELFAIFFLDRLNIPSDRLWVAHVVFQISIVSLVLNILNVPYAALLRAREMFSQMAMIEILQSLLRLGVLYLLVVLDYDKLIVLALLNFGVTLYYVGALTLLARRFVETHVFPLWDKQLVKKMLGFISMLVVTVMAQLAKTQGLVFLINMFFGLVINAAYAVAVQVSNIVNGFIISFKQSVVPQMFAAYGSGDISTMHNLINRGTKITYLMLLMLSIPIIYESDFLLTVWLKNPPEHASLLVSLVFIYINVSSFTYFQYQGVHATGNITKQQTWVSSIYVVNILLIWIVFELGCSFEWALYVNIFVSVLQCIVNLIFAKRTYQYNISTFLKSILLPSIWVTIISTLVIWFEIFCIPASVMRVCLVVLSDIIIVPLLGYFLLLNKEERAYIVTMITNLVKKKVS